MMSDGVEWGRSVRPQVELRRRHFEAAASAGMGLAPITHSRLLFKCLTPERIVKNYSKIMTLFIERSLVGQLVGFVIVGLT